MDPLLAAERLPRLAERAMRDAIVTCLSMDRLTPRMLVDRALVSFESAVKRALGAVRPAPLFVERDRIARELRAFVDGRLAARLRALRRADVVAAGSRAAPFDLVVRNRRGRLYAVVFRRLPRDGRRLVLLQRIRTTLQTATRTPVDGVLVYDFSRGAALVLHQAGAQRVHRYLRAS
ncbi:MAG TPA: hypothetical protein VMV65_05085 [Alphaproteobacteria bacterium]|nr:hypothetical protein [Verrucomicrobiae bacterium]HUN29155.1 hypothetical protein [Alphaproteobacteria bacterium]